MTGIVARFGADTTELDAAIGRSKKRVGELDIDLRAGVNTAAKYGAGLAAAAAVGLTALAVQGLKAVDAQAKLARQLDGTIDGLRGLQIAGSDAGVSAGGLNSAMKNLNSRLGEAQRGSGAAFDSLERLGLSAENLSNLDVDDRVATIADRMKEMGLSSQQAGDELRQLGIRQSEVINLMTQGGDAIRDARGEVDDLGLSMSAIDAAKIEAANDAFSRIGMQTEAFSQQLAVEVAPIMEAVSNLFVEMSKEAGGMGDVTTNVMDRVVSAIGFAADAVQGLRVAIAGGQVAFSAVGEVAVQVFSRIIEGWAMIVEQIAAGAKSIVGGVNIILKPFGKAIPTELFDSIQDGARATQAAMQNSRDVARQATQDAAGNFHDLAMMEMPSEGIKRWAGEVKEAADQAAQDIADANEGGGNGGGGDAGERETEAQKKRREEIAKTLESIKQANASELELLHEKHEAELEAMREFREMSGEVSEEFDNIERDAKARHADELNAINQRANDQELAQEKAKARAKQAIMMSALSGLSALMNSESKKMFRIGQLAAASSAVVDTYMAMNKAMAQLGPIAGPAAATAIGVAGFANVASIRSQSFGGGGGATGAGGASATQQVAANAQPAGGGQAEPQRTTIIQLEGESFGRGQVRQMIDRLNEEEGDGSRFMVRG